MQVKHSEFVEQVLFYSLCEAHRDPSRPSDDNKTISVPQKRPSRPSIDEADEDDDIRL